MCPLESRTPLYRSTYSSHINICKHLSYKCLLKVKSCMYKYDYFYIYFQTRIIFHFTIYYYCKASMLNNANEVMESARLAYSSYIKAERFPHL